jgi:hypothetical protein
MSDEGMPVSSEEETQAEFIPPDDILESAGDAEEVIQTADFVVEQVVVEEKPKPADSFWQRLKKILWGSVEGTEQRLRNLSLAIEHSPDTPVNYVLRGELYLDIREYELAEVDFQRALELASAQFEASDWGGIAQVMRDRAEAGLARARRQE